MARLGSQVNAEGSKADLLGHSLPSQASMTPGEPENTRDASPSGINRNREDPFPQRPMSFVNLDSVPCIPGRRSGGEPGIHNRHPPHLFPAFAGTWVIDSGPAI